jgi:hypothetical protein
MKRKKIRHRLPEEVVHILRHRGGVIKSKKDYNRKEEKRKLFNEVRECGMKKMLE